MNFTKMHSLGNDYIIINNMNEEITDFPMKSLCDRHFGIGADGVLLVKHSDSADFKMEIYNADGSRAQMCGNGIRCFAKYVYDKRMTGKTELMIETDTGVKKVWFAQENFVSVDMGTPGLSVRSLPVKSEKNILVKEQIDIRDKTFYMTCVSMGNPHAVVFLEEIEDLPIEKYGIGFEYHPCFPQRVNVEFVKVLDREYIEMRVWERGVGETFACGTGASAALVAGVLCDLTDEEVTVKLKRGNLYVRWDRSVNRVILTGAVEQVFDGTYKERLK